MIKLPVFKEKKCWYLHNFVFIWMLEILYPLNDSKNCKIVLLLQIVPWTAQFYLRQIKLFHLHLVFLGFLSICNSISLIIDRCRFFYLRGRPWYGNEGAWSLHYIPYLGNLGFFILSKNKGFQSRAFLKMSP